MGATVLRVVAASVESRSGEPAHRADRWCADLLESQFLAWRSVIAVRVVWAWRRCQSVYPSPFFAGNEEKRPWLCWFVVFIVLMLVVMGFQNVRF